MGEGRYEKNSQQEIQRDETTTADALEVAPSRAFEEPVSVTDLPDEMLRNDLITLQAEIKSLAEIISSARRIWLFHNFKTRLSNYPEFFDTPTNH